LSSLSLPWESTAEDVRMRIPVRVEGRERHEQQKEQCTRQGKWHVVAKKATTDVAARARLLRRSAGWSHPQSS
jgi:hypothetical protein